jgi:hypothetical protein
MAVNENIGGGSLRDDGSGITRLGFFPGFFNLFSEAMVFRRKHGKITPLIRGKPLKQGV